MTAFRSPATSWMETCECGSVATEGVEQLVAISKCLELSVKMYFDFFFFNVKEALQWINRLLALRGRIQGEGAGCFEFSNYATVLIQYVFLCDLKILRDV